MNHIVVRAIELNIHSVFPSNTRGHFSPHAQKENPLTICMNYSTNAVHDEFVEEKKWKILQKMYLLRLILWWKKNIWLALQRAVSSVGLVHDDTERNSRPLSADRMALSMGSLQDSKHHRRGKTIHWNSSPSMNVLLAMWTGQKVTPRHTIISRGAGARPIPAYWLLPGSTWMRLAWSRQYQLYS